MNLGSNGADDVVSSFEIPVLSNLSQDTNCSLAILRQLVSLWCLVESVATNTLTRTTYTGLFRRLCVWVRKVTEIDRERVCTCVCGLWKECASRLVG